MRGVHFNGSMNLPDAETVFREVCARVPEGVTRLPDGETGDRGRWIGFQQSRFRDASGLMEVGTTTRQQESLPMLALRDDVDGDDVGWPDLGYAGAYSESYAVFARLKDEGVIREGVRFQVQYPTPFAGVNRYIARDDWDRVGPGYEEALFADLRRLLEAIPHDAIAVQWDVASEFARLEPNSPVYDASVSLDQVAGALARCVEAVPADVPAGVHLCYGDNRHTHIVEPESLALQVEITNRVATTARRPLEWVSFTVPQYQTAEEFFAPLHDLAPGAATELYFGIVPYHPADQEPGTTTAQASLISRYLRREEWGICTECGLGRAERADVPLLLDKHAEILRTNGQDR